MHRNSEAGIPSGFWHSSLQCQSMLNSKPHTSHTISAKGHASMQALQLPDTLGKVLTLPVRFVRTRNAFFTITISPSQKLPKKVVQWPYLMTKTYFVQCKFTWLHKNLAPPLHFSSVNMSTLSFCQLWNSPKKKLPFVSRLINWLCKLGYQCKDVRKGIYIDRHEHPDVIETWTKFLENMGKYEQWVTHSVSVEIYKWTYLFSLMSTYDDETMQPTPPTHKDGEKEHILCPQDECLTSTNDAPHWRWMKSTEHPIRKKGNGCGVHICGWISKKTGHLRLSNEQLAAEALLPEDQRLPVMDSHKIIYPGKGFDDWWDLKQLMDQMVHTINIFRWLHPDQIGIFLFDCSSAHEGLAHDALNVNNMNANPGGAQRHLHDTVILLNNPPPKPGHPDMYGQPQSMTYPSNYPNPALQGKAKGLKAVLNEHELAWDEMIVKNGGKWSVGKCKECKKSQSKKDVERKVAEAEAMGQEDTLEDNDIVQAEEPKVAESPISDWCCCYHVLSLQDDFANKKPMIQHYIESWGHVCMFLPKFHCELDTIEMLWGLMKYHESFLFVNGLISYFMHRLLPDLRWKIPNSSKSYPQVPQHVWHIDHLLVLLQVLVLHGCLLVNFFVYQLLILQTLQQGSWPCPNCLHCQAVQISLQSWHSCRNQAAFGRTWASAGPESF